jgi:hypothetical protein
MKPKGKRLPGSRSSTSPAVGIRRRFRRCYRARSDEEGNILIILNATPLNLRRESGCDVLSSGSPAISRPGWQVCWHERFMAENKILT